MTKKVFRIHNDGQQNSDWFSSVPVNQNLINSIPAGAGDGKKLPTSIPSPFARIDLVRTAFLLVAGSGNLDGVLRSGKITTTDNHRLIADALDIGQMFFQYNKHKDKLHIVAWDIKTDLPALLNGNAEQKHLGETIKLFLDQDSKQYNFNLLDKFYILKYNHKVIGGTSPRTLFFAAPDAVSRGVNIKFGTQSVFGKEATPLYKRDPEYIKFLFSLSKTIPNFNSLFPEFNGYLTKTLNKLQQYKPKLFNALNTMAYKQYLLGLNDILLNDNTGTPIEILPGIRMKQFSLSPAKIEANSDFVIKTTKKITGNKPLVLPVEPMTLKMKYTVDDWDTKTVVPAEDSRSLTSRTLPDQGDEYPYLTMNDFFTDSILKLPYQIDSNRFLTLNNKQFLLPLKKEIFNYFTVDDIINNKMISIEELAGDTISVKLSVPVKNGIITFKKKYLKNNSSVNQNRDPKRGTIVEKAFALSVYPFVLTPNLPTTYTVGIADIEPLQNQKIDTNFILSETNTPLTKVHKTQRTDSPIATQQSVIKNKFDIISVSVGKVENLIIPKWNRYNGNSGTDFHFAIDFGTTNSHIEYKISGKEEKAFNITEDDQQMVFLMSSSDNSQKNYQIREVRNGETYLIQEVISERFGTDELRKAPFRTCLFKNKNINYAQPVSLFAEANIGFDYEKSTVRKYLDPVTNLKWAPNNNINNKNIELYIEEMLTICRNKVLRNNGNFNNTVVTWFYPVSMTTGHLKNLRNIWQAKFNTIFPGVNTNNLRDFPESIAPFYYYKAKQALPAMAKPSVTIDIGGGTTDVMIFADQKPQFITSFRFAGDALFGDGLNSNKNINGFVQKYYHVIKGILANNKLSTVERMLESIYEDSENSPDIINALFSLRSNKNVKEKELEEQVDLSKYLMNDTDFKIVFLLFFSAIIYHIAELMKLKGFETPRNILLSGTGSKSINIIDNDKRHSELKELFEAIFNYVYESSDANINLKATENPKEITSIGGFFIDQNINISRHTKFVEVNIGDSNTPKVQNASAETEGTITLGTVKSDAGKKIRHGVVSNVKSFYKMFDKLSRTINFKDVFDITPETLHIFNDLKNDDLEDDILTGLQKFKSDGTDTDPLNETLFFYPLISKLNKLTTEISQTKNN